MRVNFGVSTKSVARASQISDVNYILFVMMITNEEGVRPVVLGSALAVLESFVALHVVIVGEDDSNHVEVIVADGVDAFEDVVVGVIGVSLMMISQACDVDMDVASFIVVVVVVVDFTRGSDGVDVGVSNVQDSADDVGVVVAGVAVGAKGDMYFCPSSWLAKKCSNIFAQSLVMSLMSSIELIISNHTIYASVDNNLGGVI